MMVDYTHKEVKYGMILNILRDLIYHNYDLLRAYFAIEEYIDNQINSGGKTNGKTNNNR